MKIKGMLTTSRHMPLINPLSERLKQARIAKGMTQQKLGEQLGLEANNASVRMNQYERGRHQPDFLTLKRISEILDVPVTFFFCEEETEADIVAAIHRLNSEQKQAVLLFIQELQQP
jgi:transcriptional regulator with XRE-family HTH domain